MNVEKMIFPTHRNSAFIWIKFKKEKYWWIVNKDNFIYKELKVMTEHMCSDFYTTRQKRKEWEEVGRIDHTAISRESYFVHGLHGGKCSNCGRKAPKVPLNIIVMIELKNYA